MKPDFKEKYTTFLYIKHICHKNFHIEIYYNLTQYNILLEVLYTYVLSIYLYTFHNHIKEALWLFS